MSFSGLKSCDDFSIVEKPQIKIKSFHKQKHGYRMQGYRCESDIAFLPKKGHLKLRLQSL